MIRRGDIIWLGLSACVTGALVGGLLLGIGMDLVVNGQPLGFLLIVPATPICGLLGWLLARRLAAQAES